MAAKIRSGDLVQVIAGRDKGKRGRVLKVYPADERVLVEGVNRVFKNRRPTQQNPKGERRQQDAPIHVSNVMVVDPETSKPSRIRFEVRDGAKHRIAVRSGADLGRI